MKLLIIPSVLAAILATLPAPAHDNDERVQARVESGLVPAVIVDGQSNRSTITERMQRWQVPGVGLAVIAGGKLAWAASYGIADGDTGAALTVTTLMQAASVSKPVAAAAAMTLVDDNTLSLDADINTVLRQWRMPASAFTAEQPITLRHLLSHTAGTTVPGYFGYAPGAPLPSLNQMLDGKPPANSPAVVSQAVPGSGVSYSGGGYQIVQRLLEDASGQSFEALLRERVFAPAGMGRSHYALPDGSVHAVGHDARGQRITGGWRVHPELAAAGLWTTPTDLARFSIALTAAIRDEDGGLLTRATAQAMFTPVFGFAGLGPAIEGDGQNLRLSHAGQNEGFRSYWVVYPMRGDGVVVMSNSEGSFQLIQEIVRSVAATYGWNDFLPEQKTSHALTDAERDQRVGNWHSGQGDQRVTVQVQRHDDGLRIRQPEGTFALVAIDAQSMIAPDTGESVSFEHTDDGEFVLIRAGQRHTRD